MSPVIQIPESVHAILSASKSATWLACAGALAAAQGVPPRATSKYATEGTAYHDVARRALVNHNDCVAYVGERYHVQGFDFTIDEDNALEAQKYVDLVRSLPGQRMIEVDLDYSALLGLPKFRKADNKPVAAGTSDAVVVDYDNKVVYGVDLKFGRGDIVYAKGNTQLRLYMAAIIAKLRLLGIEDDWLAKGIIAQPRANHFDDESMTVGELMEWVKSIAPLAQIAYGLYVEGPSAVQLSHLNPGDKQCRWCPLSGNCAAQTSKMLDAFPVTMEEGELKAYLFALDDVQLAEELDIADWREHYLSAVRAEGLARALQGHTLPNWKLVEGRRGNRNLEDGARVQLDLEALREIGVDGDEPTALPVEDAIHFALGDSAYQPRDLKSVSQLQKPLEKKAPLLWAALQAHVTQADGKPALERMEDPRPPMAVVSSEFPLAPTAGGLV